MPNDSNNDGIFRDPVVQHLTATEANTLAWQQALASAGAVDVTAVEVPVATTADEVAAADAAVDDESNAEWPAGQSCTCSQCERVYPTDECQSIHSSCHCPDCLPKCANCDETMGAGESYPLADGSETICRACTRNGDYSYINRLGEYAPEDSVVWLCDVEEHELRRWAERYCFYNEDNDEWTRDESDDGRGENELLQYNANVLSHCPYDQDALRNGALLLGVELEMEASGSHGYPALVEAFGGNVGTNYILKSDGSLNDGVELVTIPLTLDQHREKFGWADTLARVKGKAKSHGTDTCGMHVHINKRALSNLTLGKMLVFLNANSMNALVTTIAQRNSNGYCQAKRKTITDGRRLSEDRYERLNVTNRTAECRMFRGNLRPERIIKNLEFCHAMVIYCRDSSMQTVASPSHFVNWIHKHRPVYPLLAHFLNKHGFPDPATLEQED